MHDVIAAYLVGDVGVDVLAEGVALGQTSGRVLHQIEGLQRTE